MAQIKGILNAIGKLKMWHGTDLKRSVLFIKTTLELGM